MQKLQKLQKMQRLQKNAKIEMRMQNCKKCNY